MDHHRPLQIVLKDCNLLYFLNRWKVGEWNRSVLKDCNLLYFLNVKESTIRTNKFLRIVFLTFDISLKGGRTPLFVSFPVDSSHIHSLGGVEWKKSMEFAVMWNAAGKGKG